ncbi:MAG: glycosyl hydrolase [Candidatus Izemoplasmatales bacterium]|jgi:endoglucanase Acf2|nr:glycosyl hydrolase [Candidatus Izemoplasmatales bacterium]
MKKIMIFGMMLVFVFMLSCTNNTVLTTLFTTTSNITDSETETEAPTTSETTTVSPTTTEPTTGETTTEVEELDTIASVLGVENKTIIVGHYFDPLYDVKATSVLGKNLTSLIKVKGYVDYGTVGQYQLTYEIEYLEDYFSETIYVNVEEGVFTPLDGERPIGLNGVIQMGDGSYMTGSDSSIAHPINPGYIRANLLNTAVPSSGWWTSLLVQNNAGGNGIYTNPLRTAFYNEGLEITNPLDGFVQYWTPDGYQTIAQFPIALKDSYLRSTALNSTYITEVIDYSDSMVRVAMKNNIQGEDELVVTLVQGSPYVFAETNDKNTLTYTMDLGVQIEYYDLNGDQITTNNHSGDGIVVKMVQRHSGYDNSPPANVGQPEYTDKYYLVNTPSNTEFSILNNVLSLNLGDGNFISIAAINDLSEIGFYHEHGYTMITDTNIDYNIDYLKSMVYTNYNFNTQSLRNDKSGVSLLALMPHHYKYSEALLTEYSYRTVRGTLKVMQGNHFQTELMFNGLLPGFTLPTNLNFTSTDTVAYLESLDSETSYSNMENFFNDGGPYWNSKALYPLAQGIIIADQLQEEALKFSFIGKLNYILGDWFTYDGPSDERYLYYNNNWGSVYYSNDDFATASTLSDHSFTHGYLIYAAAVLAMFDQAFKEDYGLMVELLLDDYMFENKNDAEFSYLRNFDPWAGHTWAHGFGTFAEGNNLESTSEALNSWNAGYLWALAMNDTERMDAAIYGFVTEISAIKEYWFDYDEENWDPKFGDYTDVAGMVWGGKHDYATWFGANPTFIYGIQWLPSGEYLTNYALNEEDYQKFSSIYATYLQAKNGEIDTWFSNMWTIQAIISPDLAIAEFDANLILNDDYPAELVGAYWMINALDSLGRRDTSIWMGIESSVSSSIYIDDLGNNYAMVWNPTNNEIEVEFFDASGLITTVVIPANSFTKVEIQ